MTKKLAKTVEKSYYIFTKYWWGINMEHKRLRVRKNIESLAVARLSLSIKEQISEAVRKQLIAAMKIPSQYTKMTDEISTHGYLILKIMHDVNEYCAAISGIETQSSEKTEITGLLSNICVLSEKFIQRKHIAFMCKIPEEKISASINREKFCFTVLNIILNAAENTPVGGRIRVTVSKTKNFIKIVIGDNGFGMSKECVDRCFEPFYTYSINEGREKTGLGLTLARQFAIESGGRINISSGKGKGTTVSLLLPIMKENDEEFSVETPMKDIPGEEFSPVNIVLSALNED